MPDVRPADAMKWWGWGREDVTFGHEDKPAFRPFVQEKLGVDVDAPARRAPVFAELDVPASRLDEELAEALAEAVGPAWVATDDRDRVVHARGKSVRDLLRQRAGDFARLPDAVVRPATEAECVAVLAAALEADAVVIPFGGGSSISGSVEAPADEERVVLSVDLTRMDQVLEIDADSRLARIQAGAHGPRIEEQLGPEGWTLGHFPDSFTHSTLGGWIATRSSGMQSDKYGDIAELTLGMRVVTPTGVLDLRPLPATSTGPSVREVVLGSEGRLGIITEAWVQVHRLPAERQILGYLLPSWPVGLELMRDIAASEASPSVTRISDAPETSFSFATKKGASGLAALADRAQSAALKAFLRRAKGIDPSRMCLSFIGFEGSEGHVKRERGIVAELVKRHGGVCVGAGPGELYDQKKFDTPYIRDHLLERGVVADVSETAAPWSRLAGLYDATRAAVEDAFVRTGGKGFLMCHLSHSYHGGACLYFTFALTPSCAPGAGSAEEQYDEVKRALQGSFVAQGGTLSHHHAVGTEHAPWLEEDLSAPGVAILRALFEGVDPGQNLNPGKIVGEPARSSLR